MSSNKEDIQKELLDRAVEEFNLLVDLHQCQRRIEELQNISDNWADPC